MNLILNNHPISNFINKDNGGNIKLGYQNVYIRIAANVGVAAGLYTL